MGTSSLAAATLPVPLLAATQAANATTGMAGQAHNFGTSYVAVSQPNLGTLVNTYADYTKEQVGTSVQLIGVGLFLGSNVEPVAGAVTGP